MLESGISSQAERRAGWATRSPGELGFMATEAEQRPTGRRHFRWRVHSLFQRAPCPGIMVSRLA